MCTFPLSSLLSMRIHGFMMCFYIYLSLLTIRWPVLMSPRKGLTRGPRVACFEYYVLLNRLYQIVFNKSRPSLATLGFEM